VDGCVNVFCTCSGGTFAAYDVAIEVADNQVVRCDFGKVQPINVDQKMLIVGQQSREMIGDPFMKVVQNGEVKGSGEIDPKLLFRRCESHVSYGSDSSRMRSACTPSFGARGPNEGADGHVSRYGVERSGSCGQGWVVGVSVATVVAAAGVVSAGAAGVVSGVAGMVSPLPASPGSVVTSPGVRVSGDPAIVESDVLVLLEPQAASPTELIMTNTAETAVIAVVESLRVRMVGGLLVCRHN
jgi:hypothetical protein